MSRGYVGIGIEAAKTPENVGGLWRSAHAFGAAFIFTVGARYPTHAQPTDTTQAERHVPLIEHGGTEALDSFFDALPRGSILIGVECGEHAIGPTIPLSGFVHPERAVYVLGAEDHGLSVGMQARCAALVEIPAAYCLNVATTGSIVLYDRAAKLARARSNVETSERVAQDSVVRALEPVA